MKLPRLVPRPVEAPGDDSPVTMLELFFDLVFVFVITQVTTLVSAANGWAGYGRAALVVVPDAFGAGAWVFGGAYLTVVVLHAVQFRRSSLGASSEAIRATLRGAASSAGDHRARRDHHPGGPRLGGSPHRSARDGRVPGRADPDHRAVVGVLRDGG